MDNKKFKNFLIDFFQDFSIDDIGKCQILIYIIFNNKILLKEKDEEINQIIVNNLQQIGKSMDLNLLKNRKFNPITDINNFLPINFTVTGENK